MNIGLDIDNVIADLDSAILKEFLIEDKNKRNTGVIDPKAHINRGMFDWSIQEVEEFFTNNMERLAKILKPRRNCKLYMDKLLQDGHKLFLISHRDYPHYLKPEETTINWLKNNNINYTKLILSKSPDKTEECKKNNIDFMVDDRAGQCKKMRSQGINTILMFTKYNRREVGDLPFATSWKNLYEILNKKENL